MGASLNLARPRRRVDKRGSTLKHGRVVTFRYSHVIIVESFLLVLLDVKHILIRMRVGRPQPVKSIGISAHFGVFYQAVERGAWIRVLNLIDLLQQLLTCSYGSLDGERWRSVGVAVSAQRGTCNTGGARAASNLRYELLSPTFDLLVVTPKAGSFFWCADSQLFSAEL